MAPAYALAAPPNKATLPYFRNNANIIRISNSAQRHLDPELASITGFVLLDEKGDTVLDSHQLNIALPPASVTKTITAIYARESLGPDYRFETRLRATGPVSGGMIQGDLYLQGGGDPALDTDELAALATQLRAKGIRGVTGDFFVDGSALPQIPQIDPDQPDYLGYNAAISGLNLNFNRVYFEWVRKSAGYELSLDARAENHKPAVNSISINVEERAAPVFRYAKINGHDRWSVARSALGNGGGRWLPVRQPADYVGGVFRTLAEAEGIILPPHRQALTPKNAPIVAHFASNPLDEVIRWMLKYSNNMTAECLGLSATIARGNTPTNLQTSSDFMDRWAESTLGGVRPAFKNHSGLTDKARVSPLQMAGMLASPTAKNHLSGLLKPVKILDEKGEIQDSGPTWISGKTGSLNFTHALAGYIHVGAKKYTFAIFSSDLAARSAIPKSARERPRGARSWAAKAKRQEQAILRYWIDLVSAR